MVLWGEPLKALRHSMKASKIAVVDVVHVLG